MQLETDTTAGTTGGDACHTLPNGTRPVTASLRALPNRANAHGSLRGRIVEAAPTILHNVSTGFVEITDADWTIAPGASVPDGAIRETVTSVIGTAITPSETCNHALPSTYTLLDASTDYSVTVDPGSGFSGLIADSDADGLANGVEQMPVFLKYAQVLDDDADGRVDEDPVNAADDDGDTRIDEDRAPIARLFGAVSPPHATTVLNVMI
jgi:hypothetical protein